MALEYENIREIGGNSILLWCGKILKRISDYYQKRSDKYIKSGSKTVISNPTCKFINHCTIIFNFTVNTTEKYQLIHQGRFTEMYKEWNKQLKEYEDKMVTYEDALSKWERQDPEERDAAPIRPTMREFPLDKREMFETIIMMQKYWYKKS